MEALIIIKVKTIPKGHKIASNKTKVLPGIFALTALFSYQLIKKTHLTRKSVCFSGVCFITGIHEVYTNCFDTAVCKAD
jgi:hypothetical protein